MTGISLKQLLFVTALLLLNAPDIQGQLITEAYVINIEGDTLHGEIKDLGFRKNCLLCLFREDGETEFKAFKPGEIQAFLMDRNYFVSKKVNTESIDEILFAEYLVNGIIDLYLFQLDQQKYYLLETEDATQSLLKVNDTNGTTAEDIKRDQAQRARQIGTLKYFMQDYPDIYPEAEKVYFEDSRSLKRLVMDYHEGVCDEYACIDYYKENTPHITFAGLSIGAYIPQFQYKAGLRDYLRYMVIADQSSSSGKYVGFNYNTNIPGINERFELDFMLAYANEEFYYSYSEVYNYQLHEGRVKMKYNTAGFYSNLNYSLGNGPVRILPYAGININFIHLFEVPVFEGEEYTVPEAIRPGNFRIEVHSGIKADIPLSKSGQYHLRSSIEMRYALIKKLYYYGYLPVNYRYFAPIVSVSLLERLN